MHSLSGNRSVNHGNVFLSAAVVAAILFGYSLHAQAQTLTALHDFTGGPDGANPAAGLSIDRASNLYGTAAFGRLRRHRE